MKRLPLLSSILAVSLAISTPGALAHVGHGDEFQAEGGVNRVEVNAETDPLLGIQVNPVESAADGSGAVLIPVTALVDDNGRQLVFVQYENFYEPVPVTTGATQGEFVAILEGLSVGEQLVSQGSLSLYAESRKTQTAEAAPAEGEAAVPTTDEAHAQVDAQGIPHSHDASGNLVETDASAQQAEESTQPARGFPWGIVVGITAATALFTGAMTFLGGGRKRKSRLSDGTYSGKNRG